MKIILKPIFALLSITASILCEVVFVLCAVLALVWPAARYVKWLLLKRIAKTRQNLGFLSAAKRNARELLDLAEEFSDDWNYGNALHYGNLVLGHIAIKEHDIVAARQYLIKSGTTPGSPQLDSFGPNMSLANKLLDFGETEAVLKFLKLCSEFWDKEFSQVAKWSNDIRSGRKPSFGPNLIY